MDKVQLNDDQLDAVNGGTIITYQVQPGDTLNSIAAHFNVSVKQLQQWNNIQNPNIITVNQPLKIKY